MDTPHDVRTQGMRQITLFMCGGDLGESVPRTPRTPRTPRRQANGTGKLPMPSQVAPIEGDTATLESDQLFLASDLAFEDKTPDRDIRFLRRYQNLPCEMLSPAVEQKLNRILAKRAREVRAAWKTAGVCRPNLGHVPYSFRLLSLGEFVESICKFGLPGSDCDDAD